MTINVATADWRAVLEDSYGMEVCHAQYEPSRLEYLSQHVFDFTTYAAEMDELFARKAVEVCKAITEATTFSYIETHNNHVWFLVMCNMPFFAGRLNWGTSIRGAWWDHVPDRGIEFNSCGLWDGDEQVTETLRFERPEWVEFMRAVVAFAGLEETTPPSTSPAVPT